MKSVKILLGSITTVVSVVTPLTTLTSCSTTWGKALPFSIGSTNIGPYSEFKDKFDSKKEDYTSYLQTNYSNDQKSSTAYAYSSPVKYKQNGDEKGEWVNATAGWYASGDSVFGDTAKYKDDDKEVADNSPRNQALSANIALVSTIGTTINTYISNALQYATSQIKNENDLKIAWGNNSFNHGMKDDEATDQQNNEFYEYCFASSNLVGINKVSALLKTSALNFSFKDFPLPTYTFDQDKRSVSDEFFTLLNGGIEQKYWTTCKDGEDSTGKYKIYHYDAVPVIVEFNNLTQTYLNTTSKSDSFIVSDYYSNSKEIKESVGDSWKESMPSFTSKKADSCVPTYSSYKFESPDDSSPITASIKDERLAKKNVSKNSFIALMSYEIVDYDDGSEHDYASLVNIQNFFPSYFLEIYKDDPNLYKDIENSENKVKVINTSEIEKKAKLFVELLSRSKGQGLIPSASNLNQESKNFLKFLDYMFEDNEGKLNTTNFLNPLEIK